MLLDSCLDARASGSARPTEAAALRAAIEARLQALVPSAADADPLRQAIRYAVIAPGKRIRPLLTALAAQEFGAAATDALDAGCALEMVHAASLILDDLPSMDDAPMRRGQPATHVAFGEDTAVLAAVALLSRAYGVLAGAAGLNPATRCALVALLARTVGTEGLARGQFQDLRADRHTAPDAIAETNHLKTGVLFVTAVDMAALVAGAPEAACERMRRCMTHLGQAFQMLNDLADPEGVAETAGEKPTLLSRLGFEEAQRLRQRHVAQALDLLSPEGALSRFVRQLFEGAAARAVLRLAPV